MLLLNQHIFWCAFFHPELQAGKILERKWPKMWLTDKKIIWNLTMGKRCQTVYTKKQICWNLTKQEQSTNGSNLNKQYWLCNTWRIWAIFPIREDCNVIVGWPELVCCPNIFRATTSILSKQDTRVPALNNGFWVCPQTTRQTWGVMHSTGPSKGPEPRWGRPMKAAGCTPGDNG